MISITNYTTSLNLVFLLIFMLMDWLIWSISRVIPWLPYSPTAYTILPMVCSIFANSMMTSFLLSAKDKIPSLNTTSEKILSYSTELYLCGGSFIVDKAQFYRAITIFSFKLTSILKILTLFNNII